MPHAVHAANYSVNAANYFALKINYVNRNSVFFQIIPAVTTFYPNKKQFNY